MTVTNFTASRSVGSGYVMWVGTVRSLSLSEKMRVTAASGCDSLTLSPLDVAQAEDSGTTCRDIRAMAGDHGIRVTHLDPLTRWAPVWRPDNVDEGFIPFLGFSPDDFFRMADDLGVASMSAIATFPKGSVTMAEQEDSFGKVCERAAAHGLRCDIEFIPFWGIPDLATAWHLVRKAGREDTGIIFDFWHFMRGVPDFDLLATIPGQRITGVQLADAEATVPAGVSDVTDCLFRRVPMGEGAFPVERLLRTLSATGGLNNVGPEIFSAVFDALPGDEVALRCRTAMRQALDGAGVANNLAAAGRV